MTCARQRGLAVRMCSAIALVIVTGCNVTSGSRIVVGTQRPPIPPERVKIYIRPPAKFEEVAILSANSKNAFASDQSLTDSALLQMKKDAAKLGANGILLSGVGTQQIGSVGTSFANATAHSSGSATAYRYGNTAGAFGNEATTVFVSGTTINTALFAKVTNGMAIYVIREH
jgi:hypothetical protein